MDTSSAASELERRNRRIRSLRANDKFYVADSSLIPRGIVANPALTVAALAERIIERILAEDFRL